MTRARLVTYGLAAGIGALALILSWQLNSRAGGLGSDAAATARLASVLPEPPGESFELPAIEAYSEIVERPLFTHTRRPPEPEVVEKGATPEPKREPPPQWRLVGTTITGDKRAALVWDTRNKRFVRLEPGMQQSGWEVAEVQPDEVILSRGDTRHGIKMPRF